MQRSISIYGSSSVLRGVQLEIGKDFRPPNKVTLPVGWRMRDLSETLSLTYDFSLEEDVIQKAEEAKAMREKLEIEQKEQDKLKERPVPKPRVQACMGNDILQPITVTTTKADVTENTTTFNYKDFEDDTDTPFESVERQSIDNMDALKSILQPNLNNTATAAAASCSFEYNITQRTNQFDILSRKLVSVVSDSPSYPQQRDQNGPNRQGTTNDIGRIHETKPIPKSAPLPGAVKIFPGPPPSQLPPILPRRPKSMTDMDASLNVDTECENVMKHKPPMPKPRQKFPTKQEPSVDRTQPPPLPQKKNKKIPKYDVPKTKHFLGHRHESPLPPISPPPLPSKPNPLMSMTTAEKELVSKLVAMGFPNGRVIRAVKSFGCKENEIVDFLILVMDICDQGHSEIDAEMVLKEYSLDKEKAIAFLGLMRKFKQLGFSDDKLFNALKESECDHDKTLDILTQVH